MLNLELESSRDLILDQLLPQFVESMIYGAIIDAAKQLRMPLVATAKCRQRSDNKLSVDLTIQYKLRSAGRYAGNYEIVAGASALE